MHETLSIDIRTARKWQRERAIVRAAGWCIWQARKPVTRVELIGALLIIILFASL